MPNNQFNKTHTKLDLNSREKHKQHFICIVLVPVVALLFKSGNSKSLKSTVFVILNMQKRRKLENLGKWVTMEGEMTKRYIYNKII